MKYACIFIVIKLLLLCNEIRSFTKVIVPSVYDEWEKHGYPHWIQNSTFQEEYGYSVFLYQKFHPDKPNYISTNRGQEGGVYLRCLNLQKCNI